MEPHLEALKDSKFKPLWLDQEARPARLAELEPQRLLGLMYGKHCAKPKHGTDNYDCDE